TLQSIIQQFEARNGIDKNRELINSVRTFSNAVNQAGSAALKAVVEEVVHWSEQRRASEHGDETKQDESKLNLAIRPIVFGGDDVTFVCDGRIGLKAAQIFLDAFSRQSIPGKDGHMQSGRAAAGVAIVKTHYPFARAYQLSEELCKNAKNVFERSAPALDWHLAQSGLFGNLSDIRRREYDEMHNPDGSIKSSLLMRPLTTIEHPISGWHTWHNFVALLKTFQNVGPKDAEEWPRNKVLQLRDAIRHGSVAVEAFTAGYKKLPEVEPIDSRHINTGLLDSRSAYFDAIEMIEQEVW
ncbi:MAG: hypothetical protein KDE58_27350, partial [Caldilineaceae bacterium]|nr:hypothetical protein [Caldilineaceae bacterium]